MTIPMRYGLSGRLGGLETLSEEAFRELIPQLETWGYSSIWMNEEHFARGWADPGAAPDPDRFASSPLMLAAMIATLTHTIRIGFSALIVPLHHPLRLAEDFASLDRISRGRADFGISRGHAGPYFEAFGVPSGDRTEAFRANLDEIRRWWAGETFQIGGRDVALAPQPYQRPHPPIYIAAYSNESVTWAAQQGFDLIQHGIQSVANLRRCLTVFGEAGGDVANVPVGRFVYVGETDKRAYDEAWPVVEQLTSRLRRIRSERFALIHDEDDLEPSKFYDTLAIIGGPETCAQKIVDLRQEMGVQRINLLSSLFGLVRPELLVESLRRFGTAVGPALA